MSQSDTIFSYNGAEYEFDIRDADSAELFEKALDDVKQAEADAPKAGKIADIYRAHCKIIKGFFDTVLGDGAGEKVCTERSNVKTCYDAYVAFLKFVDEQKREFLEVKNTFGKYSNRQRRQAPHTIPAPANAKPGKGGKGGKK